MWVVGGGQKCREMIFFQDIGSYKTGGIVRHTCAVLWAEGTHVRTIDNTVWGYNFEIRIRFLRETMCEDITAASPQTKQNAF